MLWGSFVFPKGAGWTYVVIVIVLAIIILIWAHRTRKLYE
jgi:hypothetical protein